MCYLLFWRPTFILLRKHICHLLTLEGRPWIIVILPCCSSIPCLTNPNIMFFLRNLVHIWKCWNPYVSFRQG
uniref:Uncharacterized protein n=1 Tax=Arundo donax TaxID=35708 RepID=A0A0A9FP59_ARUDO